MKKLFSLILVVILVFGLAGCDSGDKLSGSFSERDEEGRTGRRYEFLINDSGRGDYGGELKIYNAYGELDSTNAWYIDDDLVYINGTPCYIYRDGLLYSDEPIDGIEVSDDGKISGNNERFDKLWFGGLYFTDSLETIQLAYPDAKSNPENNYYIAITDSSPIYGLQDSEWGVYVIENDVVILYDEGDTDDLDPLYYYIVDNTLRGTRLDPV